MKRNPSKSLSFALVLATLAGPAQAQVSDPVGGAAFLLVPIGARATALGQAAVAAGGTPDAAFWNPAGLASMTNSEFALHYAKTFASENSALSLALVSEDVGVLGFSVYVADFGSQDVTTPLGSRVGQLSPKHFRFLTSLATEIAHSVALGINYKVIQFRQDCSGMCVSPGGALFESIVGTTHAIDAGLQYSVGPENAFTLGVVVKHAGSSLQLDDADQADPLPTRVQVGGLYRLPIEHSGGTANFDVRLLADLEEEWGNYHDPEARVGIEVSYGEAVHLRSGYAFLESANRGPSVGLGLQLGGLTLDFARVFYQEPTLEEPFFVTLRAAL